jgi:hypothetical protein
LDLKEKKKHEGGEDCIMNCSTRFTRYYYVDQNNLRCVGHVTCMGEMINAYKLLDGNQKERKHL